MVSALVGGALIGLAAAGMLLGIGRIAGVSGIAAGLLAPALNEWLWRLAFIGGLVAGGLIMSQLRPEAFGMLDRSVPALLGAGLLVGAGTRLANGCTSGHGVCGLGRGSPRSLVATVTFMATGALSALVVHRLFGGAL